MVAPPASVDVRERARAITPRCSWISTFSLSAPHRVRPSSGPRRAAEPIGVTGGEAQRSLDHDPSVTCDSVGVPVRGTSVWQPVTLIDVPRLLCEWSFARTHGSCQSPFVHQSSRDCPTTPAVGPVQTHLVCATCLGLGGRRAVLRDPLTRKVGGLWPLR